MKTIHAASLVLAIVISAAIQNSAHAAGRFQFPIGLTYSKGAQDAMDKILDLYEWEWEYKYGVDDIDTTRIQIPIGLSLCPYYEWDLGSQIGLGLGGNVGPTTFVFGILDYEDSYGGSDLDTRFSCIIPVGMDVRCTFFNRKNASPYVRVGFRYPIAFGDNIESSRPGVFGAVGVEFWRTKAVGMGLEVGYDNSVVKLDFLDQYHYKDVTVAGLTASLFVVF
jgi:hypothetical protein